MGTGFRFKSNWLLFAVTFLVVGCTPRLNSRIKQLSTVEDVIVAIPALLGDGTFLNFQTKATGASPMELVTDDFNGDGILDIATSNYTDGSVSVLFGNGDGTFQDKIDTVVGANPWSIISADFDGDSDKDIAVSRWGGDITILLNDGLGTLSYDSDYPSGAWGDIYKLEVGDFDNDSNADLAVATWGYGQVSIIFGNGDGTFTPRVEVAVGGPVGLAVGDMNNDGNLDIVSTDTGSSGVRVTLGNGDRTFQATGGLNLVNDWPESIRVSDVDQDGNLDFIATNPSWGGVVDKSVTVVLGNGDGTFQAGTRYPVGGSAKRVVVDDFDGDAIRDMAVSRYDGDLAILIGNGDGTFQASTSTSMGANIHWLVGGDFNDDGVVDLAATKDLSSEIGIFLGNTQ